MNSYKHITARLAADLETSFKNKLQSKLKSVVKKQFMNHVIINLYEHNS